MIEYMECGRIYNNCLSFVVAFYGSIISWFIVQFEFKPAPENFGNKWTTSAVEGTCPISAKVHKRVGNPYRET